MCRSDPNQKNTNNLLGPRLAPKRSRDPNSSEKALKAEEPSESK
jgi:hypothetical protein